MNAAINQLISILNAEQGYLEKKSNANLDDKTANAGLNNYTKYARDMAAIGAYSVQGQAWCDVFADWALVQAVGVEKAHELLGGWSAYTPTSANYYKNMDRWHTSNPQVGDQIFFKNSIRICHTGWVVEVSGSTIYTIEGNTSGGSAVISNGGGVCKKKYSVTNSRIAGYGRPNWESVSPVNNGIQAGITAGITVGKPDTSGNNAAAMKSYLSKGDKGAEVGELQKNLNTAINAGLTVDNDFGSKTETALKKFQQTYGLEVDGKYGAKSRAKMGEVIAQKNAEALAAAQAAAEAQRKAQEAAAAAAAAQAAKCNPVIQAGQIHSNNFVNAGLEADGQYGPKTKKGGIKVLQHALNLDYRAGLVVDGEWGPKSEKALGNHYVRKGETQYLVTAVEILLMLKGFNPNGVECPGQFGGGLENCVRSYQGSRGLSADGIAGAATIKNLIS